MSFFDISLETANKFYAWGWKASLIGAAITLIGVSLLMWGTRVRDHDFESQISKTTLAAEQLRTDNLTLETNLETERIARLQLEGKTEGFRLDIAKANQAAAEAIQKAEEERLGRAKLEADIAPRRLTGEQKLTFTKLLKDNPGQIVIVSALLDGESSDFADDFDSALKEAKWQTFRVLNRITLLRGVSVGTVVGTQTLGRISQALTSIGIPHENVQFSANDHSTSAGFHPGVLYLVVEQKPVMTKTKTAAVSN